MDALLQLDMDGKPLSHGGKRWIKTVEDEDETNSQASPPLSPGTDPPLSPGSDPPASPGSDFSN